MKTPSSRTKTSSVKQPSGAFKINPREIFQMFRERWWIGALFALPAAISIVLFQPKSDVIYQTEVQLVFEPRDVNVLKITPVMSSSATPSELNNHMAQLRSKTFFEYVLASFTQEEIKRIQEAYKDPKVADAPLPSVAAIIRPNVSVFAQKGTTIIGLAVKNRNPECAALIANRYARRYIDFNLDRTSTGTNSAIVFLRNSAEETKNQVEAAEAALQAFRAKHNIAVLGENQNVILQKVSSLGASMVKAEMEQVELSAILTKIAEYKSQQLPVYELPMVAAYGELGALRKQLDSLRSDRVLLASKYGRNHPRMKANELETEELSRRLARATDDAVRDIESRHKIAEEYEANLRNELSNTDSLAHGLDRISVDYKFLEQEAQTKRATYNKINDRLAETQISSQIENVNIKIFDPAYVPSQPLTGGPSQVAVTASVLFFGLLTGIPILIGFLDTRIKSLSHVEDTLAESLLGVVRRLKGIPESERAQAFRNRSDAAMSESFRGIFSEVEIKSVTGYPKAIVVTSSLPSEGKSMTTSNLAAVFASHHRRTLLVDCDLRRPTLSKYFGVTEGVGLVQWVNSYISDPNTASGLPDGIVTIDSDFHFLPAGGAAKNATEVLDQMIKCGLIQKLTSQFDLVLFDTPPIGVFPDALLLARVCPESIYICKFESTRIGQAKKLLKRLHDTGVHVLGVIMNQMPESRIKGYGYDSYGSYDSRYYKAYAAPESSRR